MKRSLCALCVASALAFSLGVPAGAFASEPSPQWIDKDDALEKASLLIGTMLSTADFPSCYDVDYDGVGDLLLLDPLPVSLVDEGGVAVRVDRMAVWPVVGASGLIATIVQFDSGDGFPMYKLTTSLNEGIGELYALPGAALILNELGDEVDVSVQVDGTRRSIPRDACAADGLAGNPIPAASIVELQTLQANRSAAQSPVARAPYKPQLGLIGVKQSSAMYSWAACAASMAQYMTGSSLSQYEIHFKAAGEGNVANADASAVMRGLRLHRYPGTSTTLDATAWAGRVYDDEVKRWINNGLPFYAVFGQPELLTGLENAVIGGYAIDTYGNMSLVGMDPASGSYVNYAKCSGGTYATPAGRTWTMASTHLTGWQRPYGGSSWCWANLNGTLWTGWKQIGSSWYWFNSAGAMASGQWVLINGSWYYFDSSGVMETGWYKSPAGYWYYLGSDGAARVGWHSIDGYWYAFDSGGAMYTGWYKYGSDWYYLRPAANTPGTGPEGSMLSNGSWVISGKLYRFDSSGVCLNP